MAHITRSEIEVYHCNEHEVQDYLNAGWRIALPDEYTVWARTHEAGGQGPPRAPALGTPAQSRSRR